jgi:hypothetical protein
MAHLKFSKLFSLTTEDLITVILWFGLEFRKERGRIQEIERNNSGNRTEEFRKQKGIIQKTEGNNSGNIRE